MQSQNQTNTPSMRKTYPAASGVASTNLLHEYLHTDLETLHHCWRVSSLATRLALQLNCASDELRVIQLAALLHDIGKAAIPTAITCKPGALSAAEFQLMQQHPTHSARIIQQHAPHPPRWQRIVSIVLHHHEHWDGNGYPLQLAGTAIPLGSRICAVADAWDAMTHNRVYRPALSTAEATQQLCDAAGRMFDPRIVEAFLDIQQSDAR